MSLTTRFDEALVYASRLHAHQARKGTEVPYISHLLAVAGLVLEHGADEDTAIAALLHDAVEDQGGAATREEIRRRFGDTVVQIIDGCTDADVLPKPPWRERKEKYIAHIREASPSVLLVSAADKLHNVRTILADYRKAGEALWDRFNGGREGTLWYYRSLVEAFREVSSSMPLVEELDQVVSELERPALAKPGDSSSQDLSRHLDVEEIRGQLQKQQRRMAVILETMRAANNALDLETLLERAANDLISALGAPYCGIYILDLEQNEFALRITAGNLTESRQQVLRNYPLNLATDPFVHQILNDRQSIACHDVQADARVSRETAQILGFRSVLIVPIYSHGPMFGLAMLGYSEHHQTFAAVDIALGEAVMNLCAVAIENARLDMEAQQQRSQTNLIEGLFQASHIETLWEPICTLARSRADARGSSILLLEEGWLRVAFSTGEARPSFERVPVEGTLFGDVVRNIEPVLENDPDKARVYSEEAKSLLAVPLRVEGHVIGVMVAVNRRGDFESYHLSSLSQFADLAAVAIDNALLRHQVEQRTAAENP
jgi:GAF domain-containing protein